MFGSNPASDGKVNFMKELTLLEGNELIRFIGTHIKNGYAIVSACRGENTTEQNNAKTKELRDLIKASGFSFKPVSGGFIENKGKTDEKEVHEKSFVIYNFKQNGEVAKPNELLNLAMRVCRKYKQDSILYSEKGDKPRYYTKTGHIDSSFGNKFILNDKQQEYFTDMKKGSNKRFTLDWEQTLDSKSNEMKKKAKKAAYNPKYFNY